MQEAQIGADGADSGQVARNPDWTRDETILLMDLYLSAPRAGKNHPEVLALSAVLRAAGRRDGRGVLSTFRNPVGIAMRLRNFGRHDPQAPVGRDVGLRPGGVVDAQVWREFGGDRVALAGEVSRIRWSITADAWTPRVRSSRGPVPSFGRRFSQIEDGPTGVYLLLLDGPLELLAPGLRTTTGWAVSKFGRTCDLERRVSGLSCGLPPSAAIHYIPIGIRMFENGRTAHRFERRMLDLCDQNGWSLGGEFAYAPVADLKRALASSASPEP